MSVPDEEHWDMLRVGEGFVVPVDEWVGGVATKCSRMGKKLGKRFQYYTANGKIVVRRADMPGTPPPPEEG